jgi:pimeloyl-ACP methyl ester carboxylesterase
MVSLASQNRSQNMSELKIVTVEAGTVSFRQMGRGQRKILFFHGFPGSSLQIQVFEKWVESHNLEIICFDRPGYNRTVLKTQAPLEATVQIAKELLDQLNWKSCELVCVSGGTPAGLAFAHRFQDQVSKVHVVSGLTPLQDPDIKFHIPQISLCALRLLPLIPGRLIQRSFGFQRSSKPSGQSHRMLNFFLPSSEADRSLLNDKSVQEILQHSLFEALSQEALGPKLDAQVFLSKWDSDLQQLRRPVHFWHGEEDQIISHAIVQRLSRRIPNSTFHLVEAEGHFSLPVRKLGDILEALHCSPMPSF